MPLSSPLPDALLPHRTGIELFIRSYKATILWTTSDDDDEGNSDDCLDKNYSVDDFHPDSALNVEETCLRFIDHTQELLLEAVQREGYTWERAGYDFWMTSVGAGVGFYDRDELSEGDLSDLLSERCRDKSTEVYLGDDKKVHHEGRGYDYMSDVQRIERERVILRKTLDDASVMPPFPIEKPRARL